MEGEAVHLNNQFNGSGEDKQYESVNTPNVTIDEKMDEDKDFNEDIIKNIAVEKELSEIASAYNLHRNENAAEEMDTGPAQESLDFQNDKVLEPAQQSSETIGWDSPDLSSEITETSTNPNHSDKSKEPTATVADQSENHQDETSADTEDAKQDIEQKNNPEETNNSEETSRDMEDASKDSQENSHKDMEENSKETEASNKDTEVSNKDMEENSKDTEASCKDGEESSQDSKDVEENNEETNKDDEEDGSQNNENSQNGDEEEESEDEVPISKRIQVKKEAIEDEEEAFQEGMCGLCKEELDTNDNTLINKHLAEKHVSTDDNEFRCGECAKEYTERRGVVRHILNYHLNFKPYKCDECPKAFARKDHLTRHKNSHDPCFACKFCTVEFPSQAKLDKHLYKEHKEIFTSHKAIDLSDEEEVEEVSGNSDNDDDDDNVSQSQSESEEASDSDDDSSPRRFGQRKRKSTRIRKTVASKRPRRGRGRPPKKETLKITLKTPPKKSAPPKKTKKELEREERERKKEAELKRKRDEEKRKKEAEKRRRQKEKMREEERALERLKEKERLRKERQEREEAKEKAIKEEMQRRLEETLRKQKEEEEHYYDGNYVEPAPHPMKETNHTLDDYSINYTNFYGGNYHEPPKKTLAQIETEKSLMVNFEFQGLHFLSDSKASPEAKVKVKTERIEVNPNAAKGICGLCGEEYDDSDYQALSKHIYEKHIDNATSDKKCAICGKEYSERKGLNRHMLHSHLNYKPHRCPYCPKSFSRKYNLQDHLNRHLSQHSEDKQYICEFCMKSFTRKEHLNRHLWVHKDTFPFPCSLCSRAYTDENRLSKHIKKCHFVDNNTALETISALNINSNNNVTTID